VNNPPGVKSTGKSLYRQAVVLDTGDPLAPLRRDPATAGTFSDFYGPSSPIVEDPGLAQLDLWGGSSYRLPRPCRARPDQGGALSRPLAALMGGFAQSACGVLKNL
jgi:hypothetical protein